VWSTLLTAEQRERYDRHLRLHGFGEGAQKALAEASVLMVGVGGLGCPIALYLAGAGIGKLVLVDDDTIDRSNLQRQVLFRDDEIGSAKAEVAAQRIRAYNPDVEVEVHTCRFVAENAEELIGDCDVLIDGSDNFPTRYLINDAGVLLKRPVVHGSVHQFDGQVTVFRSPKGPCYRCLFPTMPDAKNIPSCSEAGVLGVLPGTIGLFQATEVIKLICGVGESLDGRLLVWDALMGELKSLGISKDPSCPVCGDRPTITELRDESWSCESGVSSLSPTEYQGWRESSRPHTLIDVRNPDEVDLGCISGSASVPLPELISRLDELEHSKGQDLVVYCQSGVRSLSASAILMSSGFTKVFNLEGGFSAWQSTQNS
jgi:adenylyltransferase/sulfurtransferase